MIAVIIMVYVIVFSVIALLARIDADHEFMEKKFHVEQFRIHNTAK